MFEELSNLGNRGSKNITNPIDLDKDKRSYFETTRKRRHRLVCFSVIEFVLTAYLLALIILFRNSEVDCLTTIYWWTFCYFIVCLAHFGRKVALIYLWAWHKDPSTIETKIKVFFMIIVLLPETVFYIWGNCFIYTVCLTEESGEGVLIFYWTAVAILIYGYYFMLSSILYCCIGGVMAYTYRSWTKPQEVSSKVDSIVQERAISLASVISS
jgi:hypothetical protein